MENGGYQLENPGIVASEKETKETPFDAIIVLGSGVVEKNGRIEPGFDAKMRTLAAAEAYRQGLTKNIIFTGGKTNRPDLPSEAEAMQNVLTQRFTADEGPFQRIPVDAIHLEKKAKDTSTNLENVKALIEKNEWHKLAILTNDYHLERATKLAQSMGLEVAPISAEEELQQRDGRFQKVIDAYSNNPDMEQKEKLEKRLRFLLAFDKKGRIPRLLTQMTRG